MENFRFDLYNKVFMQTFNDMSSTGFKHVAAIDQAGRIARLAIETFDETFNNLKTTQQ